MHIIRIQAYTCLHTYVHKLLLACVHCMLALCMQAWACLRGCMHKYTHTSICMLACSCAWYIYNYYVVIYVHHVYVYAHTTCVHIHSGFVAIKKYQYKPYRLIPSWLCWCLPCIKQSLMVAIAKLLLFKDKWWEAKLLNWSIAPIKPFMAHRSKASISHVYMYNYYVVIHIQLHTCIADWSQLRNFVSQLENFRTRLENFCSKLQNFGSEGVSVPKTPQFKPF